MFVILYQRIRYNITQQFIWKKGLMMKFNVKRVNIYKGVSNFNKINIHCPTFQSR